MCLAGKRRDIRPILRDTDSSSTSFTVLCSITPAIVGLSMENVNIYWKGIEPLITRALTLCTYHIRVSIFGLSLTIVMARDHYSGVIPLGQPCDVCGLARIS